MTKDNGYDVAGGEHQDRHLDRLMGAAGLGAAAGRNAGRIDTFCGHEADDIDDLDEDATDPALKEWRAQLDALLRQPRPIPVTDLAAEADAIELEARHMSRMTSQRNELLKMAAGLHMAASAPDHQARLAVYQAAVASRCEAILEHFKKKPAVGDDPDGHDFIVPSAGEPAYQAVMPAKPVAVERVKRRRLRSAADVAQEHRQPTLPPGVNRVVKRRADGTTRTYFYVKGGGALRGEPGTPEFAASYEEAIAGRDAKSTPVR